MTSARNDNYMYPLRKWPTNDFPVPESPLIGRVIRLPQSTARPFFTYRIIRVFGNVRDRMTTPESIDWEKYQKNVPSIFAAIAPILDDGTLGKQQTTIVVLSQIEQPDGKTQVEREFE